GRVVDCTGLENRQRATVREFESHRFRQNKNKINGLRDWHADRRHLPGLPALSIARRPAHLLLFFAPDNLPPPGGASFRPRAHARLACGRARS
ncbi:MAG: hypothetical protein OJK14_19250, partial [Achromobacter sp.]|uniref:hypothetical protein n=1 Tax=Achromobacter sp. TaxID=134375 RepID=UPI00258B6F0A